jgi:hypothetical protein
VWVSIDMVVGIIGMFTMTLSKCSDELADYRPTATLLGIRTMSSIAFPFATYMIALFVSYGIMWSTNWYHFVDPTHDLAIPARFWFKKGDNYDSSVCVVLLFTCLATTQYVNSYGGVFRRNILRNPAINIFYAVLIAFIFALVLAPPNAFPNCIYRVNCDTNSSIGAANVPILPSISVGGVGGCFMGSQYTVWQKETDTYWPPYVEHPIGMNKWQPGNPGDTPLCPSPNGNMTKCSSGPEEMTFTVSGVQKTYSYACAPPQDTLAVYPYDSPWITPGNNVTPPFPGCYGPNNCWSTSFRWVMLIIIIVYALLNHAFVKIALLGKVAATLRSRQRIKDEAVYGPHLGDYSSDEEGSSDVDTDPE